VGHGHAVQDHVQDRTGEEGLECRHRGRGQQREQGGPGEVAGDGTARQQREHPERHAPAEHRQQQEPHGDPHRQVVEDHREGEAIATASGRPVVVVVVVVAGAGAVARQRLRRPERVTEQGDAIEQLVHQQPQHAEQQDGAVGAPHGADKAVLEQRRQQEAAGREHQGQRPDLGL
jgi:hypothetical protein